MTRSSLDLSDRPALRPLGRLLSAVQQAATDARILLVGAAARDLLLVHGHGLEVQRATEDTDLALAVRGWNSFLRLREALIASGRFSSEGQIHRLWFGDQRVDLIPFGGVERADRTIAWPPDGDDVMNVAGLLEALETAVAVRLPNEAVVDVASLPALALLKIWAWDDRKYLAPGKDAFDLWLLLRCYSDTGTQERLYGDEGEAAQVAFDFDLEKAGAWLLGRDARDVLAHGPVEERALESLDAILRHEVDPDGALRLIAQMPPGDRERQLSLLAAFCVGLFDRALSEA